MFCYSFPGWEWVGSDFLEEDRRRVGKGCVQCYNSVVYIEIPVVHDDCNMNYVK